MYVNFLSTYSDKKSCHTLTTLQTSIARFVSDNWASCFSRSGSYTMQFIFSVPNVMAIFRRGPSERRHRMQKSRSQPISGSTACCECQVQYIQLRRTMANWWYKSLVSGGVCWWREMTTKCMTMILNVMLKTTEQHLIVRSGNLKPK